jgi:hypothetical protein
MSCSSCVAHRSAEIKNIHFVLVFAWSAQSHLADDGVLVCEVGGLRAAVEAAYPHLPFEWLSTSQSEDMVFLLRKADFEADVRRVTASNPASSDSSDGSHSGSSAPVKKVADAMAAREAEASPFADALSAIARGGRQTDPAMERAVATMQTEDRKTAAAAAKKAAHKAAAAAGRVL